MQSSTDPSVQIPVVNVDFTINMNIALLKAALAQHVDEKTTGLKCASKPEKKTDRQPQTNRFAKHKKIGPAQPAFKNRQSCINVQDQV